MDCRGVRHPDGFTAEGARVIIYRIMRRRKRAEKTEASRIPMYIPLTANPFRSSEAFRETAPHPVLRDIVRCFWGGDTWQAGAQPDTIIPDTCCDLIYRVNEITGEISGHFCGVSSEPFQAHREGTEKDRISLFGIRFFAWQAYRFSDDALRGTLNAYTPAGVYFAWLDRALRPGLIQYRTLEERARYAECLLLSRGPAAACRPVEEAVGITLATGKPGDIAGLARSVFVSTRQLERLFAEYAGLSPKKLGSMIRYQMVWRDALTEPRFSVAEAVDRYGYFDEAHLHHEFNRYHSTSLKAACRQARKDVAFLQDGRGAGAVCYP